MADHLLSKYYMGECYEFVAELMKTEALKYAETKWAGEENAERLIEFQTKIVTGFTKLENQATKLETVEESKDDEEAEEEKKEESKGE